MECWYAFYTKAKAEHQVATSLQQRDIETYLPEFVSTEAETKAPLFPCYLFARLDLAVTELSTLRWIPGLRRIVEFGEQPVVVDDQVIDLIRFKLIQLDADHHTASSPHFELGELVRVTEGPFNDLLAIFEGPTTSEKRVQVLLNFLGVNRVVVDRANLEKVDAHPKSFSEKRPRRTRGRGRRIKNVT